ncbi:hypothetical protein JX265_003268 [Neoarthrinium moseri]|uniref:Dehydrogenase FUB6 n=1 Tax=Neoarthrinium moseri TaxID=1658444 RepID=A0A9P9WUB2_9PEZI|nr:uncharacterized protein JN550_005492 [Neoarthrinium moseri]KAI1852782.1 hypothetical protein JX266_002323 [Neoarthrinium moseri]KAI1869902.1 hypothetical protein JN550_005492 [Neoarthrinium moseri]KAI1879091.1 hypothetical protein JX265_003268 [Neoarthrinium moseri]
MTETVPNKTWVFREAPTELPSFGINTVIEDRPLRLVPPPGGLVIKLLVAGLDPHQRDRMRGAGHVDYVPGYEPNEPITNFSVARVVSSDNDGFVEGDLIQGSLPISEYGLIPKELIEARAMASPLIWKATGSENLGFEHYVGPLGLAGMTAWNSFYGLVKPVKGETIWVNAASSSVGEVVVQLAKMEGMRVIASVSSDEKLDYVLTELGADAGFNYRREPVSAALRRLAPDGLDVVFENVGGEHFQAAIENMKWFGRIISCGMASQYNLPSDKQYGVTNLSEIFRRRIHVQGFIFWDENIYTDNIESFRNQMPRMVAEGRIKSRYTSFQGIEQANKAFLSMFTGGSFGKTILRVAEV